MHKTETLKKSREQSFIGYALDRMKKDNAFGAALRRADNPATEYQVWEYLAAWCDIDSEWKMKPYATIAAAIARAKPESDGTLGIGKAIAGCYEDGNKSDSAKSKLRRLLGCSTTQEACLILRPLLSLISSHSVRLCYGRLLKELIYYGDGERIKAKWAVDFYGRSLDDDRLSS